ncbi:hypothetical protein F2Q70_00031421 [Brassica cretica]|uniref:Uncharacterized protein n=1 Tax=Brassica cretica TaxID=69181 RepID=A0A8S9FE04_BRACR|nr:hypothetical protein F2Q70_00031421 [Brassica cretica]
MIVFFGDLLNYFMSFYQTYATYSHVFQFLVKYSHVLYIPHLFEKEAELDLEYIHLKDVYSVKVNTLYFFIFLGSGNIILRYVITTDV